MQDTTLLPVDPKTDVKDGGPVYAETDMTRPLPEPWNGFSSLSFVVAGIWWLIVLSRRLRENMALAVCMAVLVINGIGSTLFHALRTSKYFLMMDWMPIMLLGLLLIFYLWSRALGRWWLSLIVVPVLWFGLFSLRTLVDLPQQASISVGYGLMALTVVVPLVIHLIRTQGRHLKWMLLGGVMYGLGMFFRVADTWWVDVLPMGTHFLWHLFNGLGAAAVTAYVYRDIQEMRTKRSASVNKEFSDSHPSVGVQ
jgi:hypothetical protein